MLSTVAVLFLLLPWVRTIPRLGPLPTVSWPLAAGGALALAGVVGFYLKVGRPDLASGRIPVDNAAGPAAAPANASAGPMSGAIDSLQARLATGGGSADDWELLAKSYEFVGRPADAAKARARQLPESPATTLHAALTAASAPVVPTSPAPVLNADSLKLLAQASAARRDRKLAAAAAIYAKLAASGQMNADGWADYADTVASVQGGRLAGAPETYIARSLALDAQHPKALWLQASLDEEAGRFNEAVGVWQRLIALLEPNSADARIVSASMQQDLKFASASASMTAVNVAAATTAPAAAAQPARGRALSGQVALADSLRGRVANGQALFIVAKSVDAPGIPLAVYRGVVAAWPVRFTLDDSQSMLPGRNLSNAAHVTVEARISSSGQAMPASGDLLGTSPTIDAAAGQPLNIVIDRVVP